MYTATARPFISYRDQHAWLRADARTLVDVGTLNHTSIWTDPTGASTQTRTRVTPRRSHPEYIRQNHSQLLALSCVHTAEIGRAHREGDLHIHDLDMLAGYCAGWSLRVLLEEGLNGVPDKVEAKTTEALLLCYRTDRELLWNDAERVGGAQAFSSFDIYGTVRADRQPHLRTSAPRHPRTYL